MSKVADSDALGWSGGEGSRDSLSCLACGQSIALGERRVPVQYTGWAEHERCRDRRTELRERFQFYITDPLDKPETMFSLYYRDGDGEHPIAARKAPVTEQWFPYVDGETEIDPTERFITAVARAHRTLPAPMKLIKREEITSAVEGAYPTGERPPEHEVWAIHRLVDRIRRVDVYPLLDDLREFVDNKGDLKTDS